MGRKSAQKGTKIERELRILHEQAGIKCRRVPLSGMAPGDTCDLEVLGGRERGGYDVEVKYRATSKGWITVQRWLGDLDELLIDYPVRGQMVPSQRLHVMSWSKYIALILGGQTLGELDPETAGDELVARRSVRTTAQIGAMLTWLGGDEDVVDLIMLRHKGVVQPIVAMRSRVRLRMERNWRDQRADGAGDITAPAIGGDDAPAQSQMNIPGS